MRTIKFRGKRLDNNEWVYGFLYQLELLPYGGLGTMILTDDDNCESDAIIPFNLAFRKGVDLFMVDPDTVGQFTGLQDVDGTEIYEGDRVFFNDPLNDERSEATVYWNETFLRFMLCTGVGDYDLTDSDELQLKVNHATRIMVNVNTKQP